VLCVVRWRSVVSVVCCQVEVCCECCVLSGSCSCDGLVTPPKNAIECVVSQRDLANSTRRRPRPAGAVEPRKKKLQYCTGSSVLKRFTVDEVSET